MSRLTTAHKVDLARKVFRKYNVREMTSGELFERALSLKKGLSNADHTYFNFLKAIRNSDQFDTSQRGRVILKGKTPRSRSQAAYSQGYRDTEKQDARDFSVGKIQKVFPDCDWALRFLGFPEKVGLTDPKSVEQRCRALYPGIVLVGLEKDSTTFKQMQPLFGGSGFFQLLKTHDLAYFKKHCAIYDVIWLDYCGGVTLKVEKALRLIFEKKMLAKPSLLIITTNQGGRPREASLSDGDTRDHILECGADNGYKVSMFGALEYNQTKKNPMRISAFRCSK